MLLLITRLCYKWLIFKNKVKVHQTMIQKVKILLLSLSSLLILGAPLAFSGVASADLNQSDINNNLCGGSNINFSAGGNASCNESNKATNTAGSLASTIINILSLIVGAVAVIMLIIGGFRYVASGGKQESVSGAKNTILYALIGLVIVALAQLVVHFVLNKVTTAAS